jgi:Rha family phage regulatory protein
MGELQFSEHNSNLYLDSRDVAEMVNKDHKHLMRDIRGYIEVLKISPNLDSSKFFIESSYKDSLNRSKPCFYLTRKGCELVAHKMTGEKGVIFTATYVTKFEEMENELKALHQPSYMIEDPIKRAERWIAEQKEKQQIETKNLMLEQQLAEAEPKVTYYDRILSSPGTVTVTQIAKDYGLSAAKLNKILHEERVQYKQSRQWFLYSNYADKGYTKSETHIDGKGEPRMNTKWTQKGRLFIHQLLNNIGINAIEDEQ